MKYWKERLCKNYYKPKSKNNFINGTTKTINFLLDLLVHVKIYEVIESLNNKVMIANPITLKNYFEKDNMLNDVGGTEYLVKLTRF